MNENVRPIGAVPPLDHATRIADGLESLARDIREGKFPVPVQRCCIVLSARKAGSGDDVCFCYYGADASTAETVGLLEMAKLQAVYEDE